MIVKLASNYGSLCSTDFADLTTPPLRDYCATAYVRQVLTSGAGGNPGAPGLYRSAPSDTMQKFRTPL